MPRIELRTDIKSTLDVCFHLSRSVDLHKFSTASTNEQAVAGKTSGLLHLNETVTWRATHFFIRKELTSRITAPHSPTYFVDEQVKGIFGLVRHQHTFVQNGDSVMTDIFDFESPAGMLGKLLTGAYLQMRCGSS